MLDVFCDFDNSQLGEMLVSFSRDLDWKKFLEKKIYIQKLINYVMEERNVSDADIYRGLFVFNFNFDKMNGENPMMMFNQYLLKRYFLAGGDKEIVDNLNCSTSDAMILSDVEKDGRMGYVLSLFVSEDKRNEIKLEIEVPKIYTLDGLVRTECRDEIFVTRTY